MMIRRMMMTLEMMMMMHTTTLITMVYDDIDTGIMKIGLACANTNTQVYTQQIERATMCTMITHAHRCA